MCGDRAGAERRVGGREGHDQQGHKPDRRTGRSIHIRLTRDGARSSSAQQRNAPDPNRDSVCPNLVTTDTVASVSLVNAAEATAARHRVTSHPRKWSQNASSSARHVNRPCPELSLI